MEYSNTSINSNQNYSPLGQELSRVSGSNTQSANYTFPTGESSQHQRAYGVYSQAYQSPNDYGGATNVHNPNNPQMYAPYPQEGHGQSLTLNQLLQGGASNTYQQRPPNVGQAGNMYRTYEPYVYGYKQPVSGVPDRSQMNVLYGYSGMPSQRYAEPYGGRGAYPGYPSGPPVYPSYYQNQSMPPQNSGGQLRLNTEFSHHPHAHAGSPVACSSSGPPTISSQTTTPLVTGAGGGAYAGGAVVGSHPFSADRSPSAAVNNNSSSNSGNNNSSGSGNVHTRSSLSPASVGQLPSPVHSSQSQQMVGNNWPHQTPSAPLTPKQQSPAFGSPQHLPHGQPTVCRPRSRTSIDSQVKLSGENPASLSESYVHGSRAQETSIEAPICNAGMDGIEESLPRPHSRLSDCASRLPMHTGSGRSSGMVNEGLGSRSPVISTCDPSISTIGQSLVDGVLYTEVRSPAPRTVSVLAPTLSSSKSPTPQSMPKAQTPGAAASPSQQAYASYCHQPAPCSSGEMPISSQRPLPQVGAPRAHSMPPQLLKQPYSPYQQSGPIGSPSYAPMGPRAPGYYQGPPGGGGVMGYPGTARPPTSVGQFIAGNSVAVGGASGAASPGPQRGGAGSQQVSCSSAGGGGGGASPNPGMMPPPAAPPPAAAASVPQFSGAYAAPGQSILLTASSSYPSGQSATTNTSSAWEQTPATASPQQQAQQQQQISASGAAGVGQHFPPGRPSPNGSVSAGDRGVLGSGYSSQSPQVALSNSTMHTSNPVSSGVPVGAYQSQMPPSYANPQQQQHPHHHHHQHPHFQQQYLHYQYGPGGIPGGGAGAPAYSSSGLGGPSMQVNRGEQAPSGPAMQPHHYPPHEVQQQQHQQMHSTSSAYGPPGPMSTDQLSYAGVPTQGMPQTRPSAPGMPGRPPGSQMGKPFKVDHGVRSLTPGGGSGPAISSPSRSGVSPAVLAHMDDASVSASGMQQPAFSTQSPGQPVVQRFSGLPAGSSGYWSAGGAPVYPGMGQMQSSGQPGVPPQGGALAPPTPQQQVSAGFPGSSSGLPLQQQHYRLSPGMTPGMPPHHQQQQQSMLASHPHMMPSSSNCFVPGSVYAPGGGAGAAAAATGGGQFHPMPSGPASSSGQNAMISSQSSSGFQKLLQMGNEPERQPWLEHYIRFMDEIGKPLVGLPQVVKQPLDLYRFYFAVRARGGVLEVIKSRRWKEISQLVNINASASAAYTLRKNYCKFLLDYECRFDQGGADPRVLLAHIEAISGKKKKQSSTPADSELASGGGVLAPPAPPSPAGSHSSASSSLLPPGSGSASLSGAPSVTAGSVASDSQMGATGGGAAGASGNSASRFGEPLGSTGLTVDQQQQQSSVNGMLNSPSTAGRASASATGYSGADSALAPEQYRGCASPQQALPSQSGGGSTASASVRSINGYPNSTASLEHYHHHSEENVTTTSSGARFGWPWSGGQTSAVSDVTAATGSTVQHSSAPPMMVNGYPASPANTPSLGAQVSQDASGGMPPSGTGPSDSSLPGTMPSASSAAAISVMACGDQQQQPTVHHHATGYHQHRHHQPSAVGPPGGGVPSSAVQPMPQRPPGVGHPMRPMPFGATVSSSNTSLPHPPHLVAAAAGPTDSLSLLRMQQQQQHQQFRASTTAAYLPQSLQTTTVVQPFLGGTVGGTGAPGHLIHHHGGHRPNYVATIVKRVDHHVLPPGSIEATVVEQTRRRRYRAKDIGTVAPFKLLMALRSGLTAEISWALNCLNILLRDDASLECINTSTLPALITNLVELWRHTLGELYSHDLFVTSLELPTELTSLTWCTSVKPSLYALKPSSTLSLPPPPIPAKVSGKPRVQPPFGLLQSGQFPNGLASLELSLISLAASRGVHVSMLRSGIQRVLRKHSKLPDSTPAGGTATRNGLVLRMENLHSVSSMLQPSPAVSHNLDGSTTGNNNNSSPAISGRSRKRGRNQPIGMNSAPTVISVTSGSSTTPLNSSTSTVLTGSYGCLPASIGRGSARPEYPLTNWAFANVTMASNSLKSSEACSNLRDLALYVLDELLYPDSSGPVPHDDDKQYSQAMAPLEHHTSCDDVSAGGKGAPPPPGGSEPIPAYNLRALIERGGGDTTSHIMPPFGALPCPSRYWAGSELDPSGDGLGTPDASVLTSPPEVVRQQQSPEEHDQMVDPADDCTLETEEDGQPCSKRLRHMSASSLSCPVLSPQPLDDLTDEAELARRDEPAGLKGRIGPTKVEKVVADAEDTDSEYSQLDRNGRCPLRAREELVYYGAVSLWPDSPTANSIESRAVRCLCVSTVLRNLSFLTTAEHQLSSHHGVLALVGRTILLGHDHVGPEDTWATVDEKFGAMAANQCAWWTPSWFEDMRENALVLFVNVAGYIELINFDESIVRPILEGLLHWIICPTAASIDPFPGHRTLSPRRLALEALNRLCVHESNVDLLIATPGALKLDLSKLFDRLAHWLALPEDPVTRELALSTMHYLAGGGSTFTSANAVCNGVVGQAVDPSSIKLGGVGDTGSLFNLPNNYLGTTLLASAKPCPISGLLSFIEAAEATTRKVIDQCGVQALQERPELMGTSLEMVRRAGALLDRLAADVVGRQRFTPSLELRLLDLVTSRVLDATVAHLLCGALYRLSPTSLPRAGLQQRKPVTTSNNEEELVVPMVPPMPSAQALSELLNSKSSVDDDKLVDTRQQQCAAATPPSSSVSSSAAGDSSTALESNVDEVSSATAAVSPGLSTPAAAGSGGESQTDMVETELTSGSKAADRPSPETDVPTTVTSEPSHHQPNRSSGSSGSSGGISPAFHCVQKMASFVDQVLMPREAELAANSSANNTTNNSSGKLLDNHAGGPVAGLRTTSDAGSTNSVV